MSLLHCTPVYFTLSWFYLSLLYQLRLYFILLDSTLLFHGSSSLYLTQNHSTMGLLHCTSLYFTQRGYTSLYLTQPYTLSKFHFILLDTTLPWVYIALFDCTSLYHGSTSLYISLLCSTMAPLHSTSLYTILPCLYFTVLQSTSLYHGST